MPDFTESDLIVALQPIKAYLDEVVICGGWTLLIYRKWILSDNGPRPMATLDLDLAVPPYVEVVKRPLGDLLREAGFRANYTGMDYPAITYVKEGAPEIEFLTPMKGDRPPKPVEVQPGLQAEPLRYLEILLDNTLRVEIPKTGLRVRTPTAEAYLYQKGLSFPRRNREEKKAKDLAYMFELLHNFPDLAKGLPAGLERMRGSYRKKWFATFRGNLERYFPNRDGDGVGMVASQKPHPHDEMVRRDVTNGPGLFRQLVFSTFRDFLGKL